MLTDVDLHVGLDLVDKSTIKKKPTTTMSCEQSLKRNNHLIHSIQTDISMKSFLSLNKLFESRLL